MKTRQTGTSVLLSILVSFIVFMPVSAQAEDVAVKSAGISVEDRQVLDNYSLKLVFFVKGGPYVAQVKVSIKDQNGQEIVNQLSDGPWFYADLTVGKYTVEATRKNGEIQGVQFDIGQGQKEIALMFHEQAE